MDSLGCSETSDLVEESRHLRSNLRRSRDYLTKCEDSFHFDPNDPIYQHHVAIHSLLLENIMDVNKRLSEHCSLKHKEESSVDQFAVLQAMNLKKLKKTKLSKIEMLGSALEAINNTKGNFNFESDKLMKGGLINFTQKSPFIYQANLMDTKAEFGQRIPDEQVAEYNDARHTINTIIEKVNSNELYLLGSKGEKINAVKYSALKNHFKEHTSDQISDFVQGSESEYYISVSTKKRSIRKAFVYTPLYKLA